MKFVALVFLVACAPPPRADLSRPCPTSRTSIGEAFQLPSKVLGQTRDVNVYLPPDYGKDPAQRYPVLYMPDGGMAEDFPHIAGDVDVSIRNGVIRPIIVVGVQNIERKHDLVGVSEVAKEREMIPNAGGSHAFRAFFRDELKPEIAKRYRTTSESGLVGESAAGLFIVEVFLEEPALFDHYITSDPSVWWNERAVVRSASERLATAPAGTRSLYIANSDDGDTEGTEILARAMRAAGVGGQLELEPMPLEHHGTIFPTASLHGIRHAFASPDGPIAPLIWSPR